MEVNNMRASGFESALTGMRNPLSSWARADSKYGIALAIAPVIGTNPNLSIVKKEYADKYPEADCNAIVDWLNANGSQIYKNGDMYEYTYIGPNDLDLAMRLGQAGSEHRKYLRQISVNMDITAPAFWISELDTYKINTTRNSTSLQHKGASRDYTLDDFTFDACPDNIDDFLDVIDLINKYRRLYIETKDYLYFRIMRQLMPMGFEYTITYSCNYENLRTICYQRKNHPLKEWRDFIEAVRTLPYADQLIFGEQPKFLL